MEEQNNIHNELPKEIKADNDNVNPLLDIISSIQEKLDYSNQNNMNKTINDTIPNNTYSNPNINYNMHSNFNNQNQQSNNNGGFDLSGLFQMFGGNNSSQQSTSSASSPFMNLDMETLMRFGKIFSSMNKEDPRKNLLLSLKPFLRNNRQKNVDTYIFVLGILNVLDSFNNEGSGFNGII